MSKLYVTPAEFTNWPTGLDLQNLIPGGSSAENAAQLLEVVQAACQFVEQITYQPLYARTVTETAGNCRSDGSGRLQVRLKSSPAQQIVAAQWLQSTAGGWSSIPVANMHIYGALQSNYFADDQDYRVYFGWGLAPFTVMTQYVAAYPNALLATGCAQGATTLDVDDATGMVGSTTVGNLTVPGTSLHIYDITGGDEDVVVDSVSGTTVTLASGTLYAHAVGVRVSALPFAVSEAAIHLCEWIVKARRAGGGITMSGTIQPMQLGESEDVQNARTLLQPFKRVI